MSEKQRQGLDEFMAKYVAMTPKSKAMAQRHRQFYADPRSVTGFSKLWKEICYQIAHERSKGEAVLGAVRAARTATGREKIAVFDTDYHGMIDEFMVRGVHFKDETKTLPSSPGVPKYNVENVLVLDYDDPNVLQKLERNIGELAAVLIEPVQAQNPHWQHGRLIKAIRKITEQARRCADFRRNHQRLPP
ncbi:MAG: aminotransferase class III-fold pyridoxal phosphate-dependent enzyme [Saprospiraceae bacterium]|nr:aminotransferase class III-fold pyridoxal phosphate-dependent enzyme [Saprospiraceae bacterium]